MYSKNPNEFLTFDYEKLVNGLSLNNSISVSSPDKIIYSFGVCLFRLIEYNDTEDKADPFQINPNQFSSISFSDFIWELATSDSDVTSDYVGFNITARTGRSNESAILSAGDSLIGFKYRASKLEKRERNKDLPHLEFTGDSVQLELVLYNLTTRYKNSRFSVELALVCILLSLSSFH